MKKYWKLLIGILALSFTLGMTVACDTSVDGKDGREVVFQVVDGYIQWQYEGEQTWNNLIALSELEGDKGDKGEKGDNGKNGLSSYEIAVSQGFKGTEEEWLEALKGENGQAGLTAYEIAVQNGYKGTEEEWLESLKGENGKSGLTAYEIAVKNGYKGTEKEWLESLKGTDGETGKSVYEIAKELGFKGTEEEWLATLKGEQGDNGFSPFIGENGNWWIGETDTGISATPKNMDRIGTDGLCFEMTIQGGVAGYEVVGYTGTATDIVIPNYIFDKPVVSIRQNALPSKITSLSISSNTEYLPVFEDNYDYLQEFDFNNAPVDTIPAYMFENCDALKRVKNYGNIKHIGNYAFYSTQVFDYDFSKVQTIGTYAFYGLDSTEAELLAYLQNNNAFFYLPATVTKIGAKAFSDDDVFRVYYEGNQTVDYTGTYFYNKVKRTEDGYYYRDMDTYTTLLDYDGTASSLSVPQKFNEKNVNEVENYAFFANARIERVELPSTVTKIGQYAFGYCYNLHSLFVPDSVEACGKYLAVRLDDFVASEMPTVFFEATVFDYDGGITSPSDLSIVKYMTGIKPTDIVDDEHYVYLKKTLSCEIVTIKSKTIYADIPSTYGLLPVKKINQYAIYGDTLTSVVNISSSVEKIATKAFYGSDNLAFVNIPNSVLDVNNNGFYGLSYCTLYVEAMEKPEDWDSNWYYDVDEVVWNAQGTYATTENGLYFYETIEGKIYLTKYFGTYNLNTPLVVPDKIDGKTVYGVRAYCFEIPTTVTSSISSASRYQVIIPESITVMESNAIYLSTSSSKHSYVNVYLSFDSSSEKPSTWSSSCVYTSYYSTNYIYYYYAAQWEMLDGVPVLK